MKLNIIAIKNNLNHQKYRNKRNGRIFWKLKVRKG